MCAWSFRCAVVIDGEHRAARFAAVAVCQPLCCVRAVFLLCTSVLWCRSCSERSVSERYAVRLCCVRCCFALWLLLAMCWCMVVIEMSWCASCGEKSSVLLFFHSFSCLWMYMCFVCVFMRAFVCILCLRWLRSQMHQNAHRPKGIHSP